MEIQYAIAKRDNGWVISVDGVEILTCGCRDVAIKTVKAASTGKLADEHDSGTDVDLRLRVN